MALEIEIFPCRTDNFGYLLHDTATGRTAALDAPEETPIREALEAREWTLSDIFITHHHSDHVEAIAPLKADGGITVTGPRAEASKIDHLDRLVGGGDTIELGETRFQIFDTPGHTLGHIVYYAPQGGHLFAADALFSLGCGRMFEGQPGPMWEGLKTLRDLPDETWLYCGHEYSEANARFALSVDPENGALQDRFAEIEEQLENGQHTIPTRLGREKRTNPFLRADDADLAARMELYGKPPAEVFAALRKAKDNF